jgi:hypothetical protein
VAVRRAAARDSDLCGQGGERLAGKHAARKRSIKISFGGAIRGCRSSFAPRRRPLFLGHSRKPVKRCTPAARCDRSGRADPLYSRTAAKFHLPYIGA